MPSKAMGALKSYGLPTAMTATSDDPVDWATLFAGLRSSVPLTMLLGAREANAGEAEAVKRLPRYEQPRQYIAGDLDRELEHQYPSYVGGATAAYHRMLQKEMVEQMLREAREREASTRRADYEQPRPAPTQFIERRAAGGAILSDHTAPDMSDGGQLLADPNLYAGGGGVKKTLDEMEAELIKKGARATRAPEISRRAFFGLPQSKSFPIANVPKQELERLRDAPTFEERTTRVQPSPDAPKIEETVKKVAETPVSRRTVLKSASGQMLRNMLPEIGVPGVEDIAKSVPSVPDIIKSVVQPAAESAAESAARDSIVRAALTQASMPGVVARGIKQGIEYPDEIVDFVTRELGGKMKNINPENIETAYYSLNNPYGRDASPLLGATTRPSDAWMYFTGLSDAYNRAPLSVLKESMRSVKQTDPDIYETLKNYVRDVSAFSVENALGEGKRVPFNVRSSMGTYKKD